MNNELNSAFFNSKRLETQHTLQTEANTGDWTSGPGAVGRHVAPTGFYFFIMTKQAQQEVEQ